MQFGELSIETHEELVNTILREQLNEKIISDCEVTVNQMENNQIMEDQFCFKDEAFHQNRLKKDTIDILPKEFLSQCAKLDAIGKGAMSIGVSRYHDQGDINFGGDTVHKSMKFTTFDERLKVFRELNRMIIINGIPNGERYFTQLRCCFIERQPICPPKVVEYNFVFVMEFGRNSLGQMLKSNRKYNDSELLAILRQLLEGGDLLEKYQIAQNDFKPDNIILNKHYDQVKIIDFGVSLLLSKTANPTLLLPLEWRGGSPAYQSPQLVAAWFKQQPVSQQFLSNDTIHCLDYFPKQAGPIFPHYCPFKSDLYSIAVTICEMAGIDLEKDMIWCFKNRSEDEKRNFLLNHFESTELPEILWHMLLNGEQQRWSFEQALQHTEGIKGTLLKAEKESTHIDTSKLATKDENELMRKQKDNIIHFIQKYTDNMSAGTYNEALFNIEKCIHYAEEQGFHYSYKVKQLALFNKGVCLIRLNRQEEAKLVLQQLFAFMNSDIKDEWVHDDQNKFQYELGRCLALLGFVNYQLNKNDDGLKNCEAALTALRFNDQQSNAKNERVISDVYNTQASIYQRQEKFAKAREIFDLTYKITKKNNEIEGQAAYFNNMSLLKMQQNEFDTEALKFVDNAILLFEQEYKGKNNIDLVNGLFIKCTFLVVLESEPNQTQQQQSHQLIQQSQQKQQYEQTYQLALQIAMSHVGGGMINKSYADFIRDLGRKCYSQAGDMKSIALKKHTIRLFEEAMRAYQLIGDQENENLMREWIELIQKKNWNK